ncbi:hypothetical protein SISSUDRAFT_1040936 [Sistotremastrum suecicum HHB10207 ss-3]|uniref:Uncharacterized protein n=1 Tax=Sistotremastrum suecicum HHB10207 ss-3 TaxID=1314776 RepID=A0A166HSH0_9AGAM|nr:hypothetical protein SISSUDRAFT_1040936 [Sistotremastrum suecicum HHB10207 ss-3]
MHLARQSIFATNPTQLIDIRFEAEGRIFTCSTPSGFAIYETWPLKLLKKRELKNGTLNIVHPFQTSSILFLVGGGRSPHYPRNKVIIWDEAAGREAAELEFREPVLGLACRRGWLSVAFRSRVVLFKVSEKGVSRVIEYATWDNPRGLVAMASTPGSTLLAILGQHAGHVQLIHLSPCPPPPLSVTTSPTYREPRIPKPPQVSPKKAPPFIVAHKTALTTLSVTQSGRLLATTSSQGTLVRVWDATTGGLVKELRRGSDKAEIYGTAFRPDEQEICCWSDKGTVHIFSLGSGEGPSNRTSSFSPLSPFIKLPKYFASQWSYAHYRLPAASSHIMLSSSPKSRDESDAGEEEKCIVTWIEVPSETLDLPGVGKGKGKALESKPEYQLIALTYSGGWYRLALPSASAQSAQSDLKNQGASPRIPSSPLGRSSPVAISRPASVKGKEKEDEFDQDSHSERRCTLQEFRRFGRWDGWG